MTTLLPVSLGEAIDKLTILDIKMDKIMDDRKQDVKNEYDLLYEKLKEFIIKYKNLYDTMKKVNLLIWDMMNILRNETTDEKQYFKICKECTDYNDVRFRVKNKINCISGSLLKEQKSYKKSRFVIILKTTINSSDCVRVVKYLSFIYDEILIASNFNQDLLKKYFSYDMTILFTFATADWNIVVENESELCNLFVIEEINKLI
jgi:hypothetical protein